MSGPRGAAGASVEREKPTGWINGREAAGPAFALAAGALARFRRRVRCRLGACAARASGSLASVHSTIPARLFVCPKSRS
jgi:hypothetical protein